MLMWNNIPLSVHSVIYFLNQFKLFYPHNKAKVSMVVIFLNWKMN